MGDRRQKRKNYSSSCLFILLFSYCLYYPEIPCTSVSKILCYCCCITCNCSYGHKLLVENIHSFHGRRSAYFSYYSSFCQDAGASHLVTDCFNHYRRACDVIKIVAKYAQPQRGLDRFPARICRHSSDLISPLTIHSKLFPADLCSDAVFPLSMQVCLSGKRSLCLIASEIR